MKSEETKIDLLNMICKLSQNIGLSLEKTNVKDIIKVNKNKQENSTIIVKFTNTFIKNDIMKAAKTFNIKNKTSRLSAKHLNITSKGDVSKVISENLTPKAARLYLLDRDFKTSKQYKYCWKNYGKVYVPAPG